MGHSKGFIRQKFIAMSTYVKNTESSNKWPIALTSNF
jgi:hypothetical protein